MLEKSFNGWWFVDSTDGQGFVPQSVLKPLNDLNSNYDRLALPVDENQVFIVKKDYLAVKSDEVSITKGDYIRVIEKRLNGWWLVEYKNKLGIAPAVCFCLIDSAKLDKDVHKNSDSKSVLSFASSDSLGHSIYSTESGGYESNDLFYVIQDYDDPLNEGLSLKTGQKCRILNTENESGWWYISIEGTQNEGWAPSAFLTKQKIKPPRPPPPKKEIKNDTNHDYFSVNEEITSVSKLREIFEKKF